ncbi:ureidoglycolate lyase [Brotaphodocola sp.]|uniref:ureidoglycolate lyase n=1 Tax=Brotaphodocola sp. TaxID=3073577 RepID=UPI003D7CB615
MAEIERITVENFAPFGSVIEFPKDNHDNFYIVETEETEPWRLAVFRYSNHEIQRIERHPTSKESFEPLSGTTLLLTAETDTPENYHIFLLDRPICLKKNIWHQVLSLSDEAVVKITENREVESVFYDLPKPIRTQVIE